MKSEYKDELGPGDLETVSGGGYQVVIIFVGEDFEQIQEQIGQKTDNFRRGWAGDAMGRG